MPVIGSPFSPEMMSLLFQRKNSIDDRNLRAAIADREFINQARDREFKASLANTNMETEERWKKEEMKLAREKMGLDRDEMNLRWGGMKEASDLERARTDKATADAEKSRASTKTMLDLLGKKGERIDAQTALALAQSGLADEKTADMVETREPRIAKMNAEIEGITSRIKNDGLRTQAYTQLAEAQKLLAEDKANDPSAYLRVLIGLGDLISKTNPVYGGLVSEGNKDVSDMFQYIRQQIIQKAPPEVQDALIKDMSDRDAKMLQRGNAAPGKVADQAKAWLDALNQAK